jgi:hypothetical protein
MPTVLWNSPGIPTAVLQNENSLWNIRCKVQLLAMDDDPSPSDVAALFHRYNSSTPAERDVIDAAFVWMTGYTFATICAMVVTPNGKDYEQTLEKWRRSKA